jgi:hypothetical protein
MSEDDRLRARALRDAGGDSLSDILRAGLTVRELAVFGESRAGSAGAAGGDLAAAVRAVLPGELERLGLAPVSGGSGHPPARVSRRKAAAVKP